MPLDISRTRVLRGSGELVLRATLAESRSPTVWEAAWAEFIAEFSFA